MPTTRCSTACKQHARKTTVAAIAIALIAWCDLVHADCAPVVAAYDKAEATRRYAVYEVDSINAKPKTGPIVVVIGNVHYAQQYIRKTPINFVPGGYRKEAHNAHAEADMLKARVAKSEARCDALGERKVGATTADGFRIRNNEKGIDYAAIDLWIDRSTGLPIFYAPGDSTGGFGWLYGADVVVPSPLVD